jgi:hypothetical protein
MTDKKVDESWKEKVIGEKDKVSETQEKSEQENQEMPPVDFNLFVSSLGMQALMALGELENPITNKRQKELPQAKYLIDTMAMIQEKTKGNLNEQESDMIEQMLYQLRMKFVESSK